MKFHYGGEFHFLTSYGLSIYKDEDREEGRGIMRAFMREEGPEGRELVSEFIGEPDDDLDNDLEGHAAGFNDQELSWIKANYGKSRNFMFSFGLKLFDEEDCQEAKAILRAFMNDDD